MTVGLYVYVVSKMGLGTLLLRTLSSQHDMKCFPDLAMGAAGSTECRRYFLDKQSNILATLDYSGIGLQHYSHCESQEQLLCHHSQSMKWPQINCTAPGLVIASCATF